MRTERRLANVSERLTVARRDLDIASEQLAFQLDVAEEARVKMLVSSTPLAEREHRDRRDDLERVRRHHQERLAEVQELTAEQDRLFERLIEEAVGT